MTLAEQFDQAVQESKQLSERPSNEVLLKLATDWETGVFSTLGTRSGFDKTVISLLVIKISKIIVIEASTPYKK